MFANHIKGLKQNPSYNKSSQSYTRGRKRQGALPWGCDQRLGDSEKSLGLEVKETKTQELNLIPSVTRSRQAASPAEPQFPHLRSRLRGTRVGGQGRTRPSRHSIMCLNSLGVMNSTLQPFPVLFLQSVLTVTTKAWVSARDRPVRSGSPWQWANLLLLMSRQEGSGLGPQL